MEITIHVGLAKTATTYLQETFFPGVQDALFIHAPHRLPPQANPVQRFVRALIFRNAVSHDVPAVREEIADFLKRSGFERIIVSSEALFGWPFENHSTFRTNADLLSEVFRGAKIWLVVRRQDAWLESLYSQILKMGLSTSPERFTNFHDGEFGSYRSVYGGANLDVRDLDWSRYVDYYIDRFGADRVLVQPFEAFVAEPDAFFRRFCDFAGVAHHAPASFESKNPSLSPVSAFVARVVNTLPMTLKLGLKRWIPSDFHPAMILNRTLDPLLPRRRIFPERIATAALRVHREGNERLAATIRHDLATYGYF